VSLYEIVRAEADGRLRPLVGVATLAAVASTFMLASIFTAARSATPVGLRELVMFGLWLLLFVLASRHVNHSFAELLEAALHRIRVRIGAKLVRADFEALERIAAAEICDRVTENMRFVSERGSTVTGLLQAGLTVGCLAVYIGWVSLPALTLLSLVVVIGVGLFLSVRREFVVAVRRSAKLRVAFLTRLGDLLDGFAQLKFSRRASRELGEDIDAASNSLRVTGIRSSSLLADNMMIAHALVFALLAAVAYVLPQYVALEAGELASLIAVAIFLRWPVSALALGVMPYIRSNLALAEIAALEAKLEGTVVADEREADPWSASPSELVARGLCYAYPPSADEPGFAVGPLDLELAAGTITFVVGGNGSGKTTLLELLAGLYRPQAGSLALDGVELGPTNLPAYRERISAVFGDFHLFERIYEPAEVDPDEVEALVERMGLAGLTHYVDGRFTSLALSTGQRKRLALAVALVEDRAILLFDEWAADQDPQFRREFYEVLLPELRAAGKIIVAISHDDRYFDRADQVVTLDYGQLRSVVRRGEVRP
jgi:putative pyoverdin transport system ATP-binding/permease protein